MWVMQPWWGWAWTRSWTPWRGRWFNMPYRLGYRHCWTPWDRRLVRPSSCRRPRPWRPSSSLNVVDYLYQNGRCNGSWTTRRQWTTQGSRSTRSQRPTYLLVLQVQPAASESRGRHTASGAWWHEEVWRRWRSKDITSSNGTQDPGQPHRALRGLPAVLHGRGRQRELEHYERSMDWPVLGALQLVRDWVCLGLQLRPWLWGDRPMGRADLVWVWMEWRAWWTSSCRTFRRTATTRVLQGQGQRRQAISHVLRMSCLWLQVAQCSLLSHWRQSAEVQQGQEQGQRQRQVLEQGLLSPQGLWQVQRLWQEGLPSWWQVRQEELHAGRDARELQRLLWWLLLDQHRGQAEHAEGHCEDCGWIPREAGGALGWQESEIRRQGGVQQWRWSSSWSCQEAQLPCWNHREHGQLPHGARMQSLRPLGGSWSFIWAGWNGHLEWAPELRNGSQWSTRWSDLWTIIYNGHWNFRAVWQHLGSGDIAFRPCMEEIKYQQATPPTWLVDRAALAQLCCPTHRWGNFELWSWPSGSATAMVSWSAAPMAREQMTHSPTWSLCDCCWRSQDTTSSRSTSRTSSSRRTRWKKCSAYGKSGTRRRHLSRLGMVIDKVEMMATTRSLRSCSSPRTWSRSPTSPRMISTWTRTSLWEKSQRSRFSWAATTTRSMTTLRSHIKEMFYLDTFMRASSSTSPRCTRPSLRSSTRRPNDGQWPPTMRAHGWESAEAVTSTSGNGAQDLAGWVSWLCCQDYVWLMFPSTTGIVGILHIQNIARSLPRWRNRCLSCQMWTSTHQVAGRGQYRQQGVIWPKHREKEMRRCRQWTTSRARSKLGTSGRRATSWSSPGHQLCGKTSKTILEIYNELTNAGTKPWTSWRTRSWNQRVYKATSSCATASTDATAILGGNMVGFRGQPWGTIERHLLQYILKLFAEQSSRMWSATSTTRIALSRPTTSVSAVPKDVQPLLMFNTVSCLGSADMANGQKARTQGRKRRLPKNSNSRRTSLRPFAVRPWRTRRSSRARCPSILTLPWTTDRLQSSRCAWSSYWVKHSPLSRSWTRTSLSTTTPIGWRIQHQWAGWRRSSSTIWWLKESEPVFSRGRNQRLILDDDWMVALFGSDKSQSQEESSSSASSRAIVPVQDDRAQEQQQHADQEGELAPLQQPEIEVLSEDQPETRAGALRPSFDFRRVLSGFQLWCRREIWTWQEDSSWVYMSACGTAHTWTFAVCWYAVACLMNFGDWRQTP